MLQELFHSRQLAQRHRGQGRVGGRRHVLLHGYLTAEGHATDGAGGRVGVRLSNAYAIRLRLLSRPTLSRFARTRDETSEQHHRGCNPKQLIGPPSPNAGRIRPGEKRSQKGRVGVQIGTAGAASATLSCWRLPCLDSFHRGSAVSVPSSSQCSGPCC